LSPSDVLDTLTHLIDKSLVAVTQDGATRYRLLEPIRQYARDKLLAANEAAALRHQHLVYFHSWAQAILPNLQTPEMMLHLTNLERELDNFRTALDLALEIRPVMALRLVSALNLVWNVRGYTTEGRRWGEEALKRTQGDTSPEKLYARAEALSTVGFLTMTQGDNLAASDLIAHAVTLFRTVDDHPGLAYALWAQSTAYAYLGQLSLARITAEESLNLARELNDSLLLARAHGALSVILFQMGDIAAAKRYAEKSVAFARQSGIPQALAITLGWMSVVAATEGNLAARQYAEESLALFRQMGDKHRINMAASTLANVLRHAGDFRQAEALYREAIRGWRDYRQLGGIARCLECLAFIAIAEKRDTQAARWLGAAEALRDSSHTQMIPAEQTEYEREVAVLRARMDETTFTRVWADGSALTMEQAIAQVEQLLPAPQARLQEPNVLSPRELEVLRLLAEGLSDAQIAEKLIISRRTVNTHLTAIYGKLGVNSRSAATRHALDHKLI